MSLAVVQRVKQQLEASGADLSGPCGAFAITQRVAWTLRNQGYGLLDKPSGNNCRGYATDIVVDALGNYYDCLADGGGANTPQWPDTPEVGDVTRWRPALDPADAPLPVPVPVPPSDDRVLLKLEEVGQKLVAQGMLIDQQNRLIAELIAKPSTTPPPITFPVYSGSLFGMTITLRPKA